MIIAEKMLLFSRHKLLLKKYSQVVGMKNKNDFKKIKNKRLLASRTEEEIEERKEIKNKRKMIKERKIKKNTY